MEVKEKIPFASLFEKPTSTANHLSTRPKTLTSPGKSKMVFKFQHKPIQKKPGMKVDMDKVSKWAMSTLKLSFVLIILLGMFFVGKGLYIFFLEDFCDSSHLSEKNWWECRPCPHLAHCINGKANCPKEMTLSRFEGCVTNNELINLMEKIKYKIENYLNIRAGLYHCNYNVTDKIEENELIGLIKEQFPVTTSDFYEIFLKSLSELKRTNKNIVQEGNYLWSTSPSLPYACQFKRALLKVIFNNLDKILAVSSVFVFIVSIRWYWKDRQYRGEVVSKIVQDIKDGLKEYSKTPVPVSYLKSEVIEKLEKEFGRKEAEVFWKKISKLVLSGDSRIREYQEEVDGEIKLVWRWMAQDILKSKGLFK